MTEWAASDPDEIIDRLGEANEALIARVRQANRAAAAARTNERYYRALFEGIDDGFCVAEMLFDGSGRAHDYRFVQVNSAFQWHTGLTAVHGRTMRDLRPDLEQRWFDLLGHVASTGQPSHFTERARSLRDRWLQVSAFALGEQRPYHVGMVLRDITAERADEERRKVMGERHTFLLRMSDAVRSLTDPGEIRALTTRMLGQHLGLSRCGYGEVGEDEIVTVAHEHREPDMPSMTGTRRMADYDQDIMDVFRRGQPLVVHDVATDHRTQGPEVAATFAAAHTAAALEVPLVRGGRLAAILFAHQREPRRWTEDDVALAQDVAERTWARVEYARSDAVLRASDARKQFLLELSDVVRPLDDPRDIASTTAATLGRHLSATRCVYGEFDPAATAFTVDRDWTDGTVEHQRGVLRVGPFREALVRGETVVIEDGPPDGRSAVMVPLVKAGTLTAGFAVHDAHPRRWTSGEIALIEEVADRTWASLERAHARRALEETQARAEVALESAGMGSFVWYPEEDRGVCDARLMELYGLEAGEPLNLQLMLSSVIDPEDRERYGAAIARACDPAGDGRLNEEVRIVRPGGEERMMSILGRTEFDESGQALRMHGVVIDLTEERRAEQRDREFVANAAHELRTPLAGILAAMDALDAGAVDETTDRERFLGHIRSSAQRMSRLSESLLLLARPEDSLPVEAVDVAALLEEVAGGLRPPDGVEVAVRAPADVRTETNAGLLERVLANLAENAVAHTTEGRIELRATPRADAMELTVFNSGDGIDPEVAERAFDRFYRGTGDTGGFGLGLAIAAQAAAAIGGELTLGPGPESGTVARLSLPVDAAVPPS